MAYSELLRFGRKIKSLFHTPGAYHEPQASRGHTFATLKVQYNQTNNEKDETKEKWQENKKIDW